MAMGYTHLEFSVDQHNEESVFSPLDFQHPATVKSAHATSPESTSTPLRLTNLHDHVDLIHDLDDLVSTSPQVDKYTTAKEIILESVIQTSMEKVQNLIYKEHLDLVRGGFQPRLPTSLPPPGQQQQPSALPRRQPVPLMPPAQLHPGAPPAVAPAPAVPLQSPPPSELMDVDPSAGPPSQAVAVQPVLQPLSLGTPKESETAAPCPAPTQQPSTQRQETLPLFVGPDAPSRPVPEAAPVVTDLLTTPTLQGWPAPSLPSEIRQLHHPVAHLELQAQPSPPIPDDIEELSVTHLPVGPLPPPTALTSIPYTKEGGWAMWRCSQK
ncbi:lysine-rich arabinogalactan protein 19-like [Schistocerca americana]|uniref:lysine-rich arabinogalactan protein 19-like n=1 Tax=Schistocerca americana TaxID=7009 RepID=UPI001F4FE4C2|nr:lysine-rich arabinogalactan protein 19-like [Schistocerca americana]